MILKRFLSSEMSQRQKDLMARNLPKKRVMNGVKNVILVASGKGGVGKSTTAVNLALACQKAANVQVGLLDADVYGPSIPIMMNLNARPYLDESSKKMLPLENYGVKCMSMGFLVNPQDALVWRGPMVMGAIEKLAHGTHWDPLDLLIIDLPPGTGDIHLSLAQTIELSGAVIVSTPQKVALADAKKAVKMFQTVKIPILGLVENMSSFACSKCGTVTHVFGQDMKLMDDVPTLGSVPLEVDIMKNADSGTPIVLTHPSSKATQVYLSIAEQILKQLV